MYKNKWTWRSFLTSDWQKSFFNILPINNLPYLFYIISSNIFIVHIISMLPNINSFTIKNILLNKGVNPWGANIYWFGVSIIRSDFEMLSQASHPHPDPWIGTVFLVNSSWRLSYDPNCLVICWVNCESSPGYYPPPLPIGARFSQ